MRHLMHYIIEKSMQDSKYTYALVNAVTKESGRFFIVPGDKAVFIHIKPRLWLTRSISVVDDAIGKVH